MRNHRVLIISLSCALLLMPAGARAQNPVVEWNQLAATYTLSASPAQAPVVQLRTMAIVQAAVHDAVNGITGQYETYGSPGAAPAAATAPAAAIAAAHHALTKLFEARAMDLDEAYKASLAANGISALDPGLDYGRSAASAILALRANDGAAGAQFDYTVPQTGPGYWVRLGGAAALLPGWGAVKPFVLRSGGQFRPDPPPALTSALWAKDYNEVYEIGSANSLVRTAEQRRIAFFWRASPTAIWNPVLVQLLAARNFDLSAVARAFALVYLAAADSGIACWEAKYMYNFWRPFPAIVGGATDGNDATLPDATWAPLLGTPPHPEYPSGHSTVSAAMGKVLQTLFGDNPGVVMTLTLPGEGTTTVTREWNTIGEALQEVIDARVYSGIHYRNSDEVGARQGRQVAQFVMTHALRPPTGSWK